MSKYTIGIDFGTLSARALVVEVATGREVGTAVAEYPSGVLDTRLPGGEPLPPDWALAVPGEYLDCMKAVIPEALRQAGVRPDEVIGVGLDGTNCTVLPVTRDGTPLCALPAFQGEKHAYMKLWKHHAAQDQASRMTELAVSRGEKFLDRYGGKISSEWLFPKLLQVLEEAPEVYDRADRFVEMTDWLVSRLTGHEVRSSCLAGYKALWDRRAGYPDEAYFAALDPRFRTVVRDKLPTPVQPIFTRAGDLTREGAALTGLIPGTAVAVGTSDSHVALPGAGITGPGTLLMIVGTSTCDIMASPVMKPVPGICGVAEDGMLPGYYGYEAGQCCVGDHFNWFVGNAVPAAYQAEADARHMSLHALLTEKAARLRPGESGLLALDWWNGNRSILVDAELSGLIVGLTLTTRPEAIYRALIEATAFGARTIIENFVDHGLPVDRVCACGGIVSKNSFLTQLYADVLHRPISLTASDQTPALGSAMMGAVAAGAPRGGYDTIAEAARRMAGAPKRVFSPDAAASAVYDKLYAEYRRLHDAFGRGDSDVMRRLRQIRRENA